MFVTLIRTAGIRKAKLESSQERKRTLKASGSLTDTSLEELAMRFESVGHFPGPTVTPKRLEEGLYQNLLPESGRLQFVLAEVFEHRYQAPPEADPHLSFGDERLPPLLQMAKQCLQAKVWLYLAYLQQPHQTISDPHTIESVCPTSNCM